MKKVLAVGSFDMIHKGHLNYLEQARKFGDYLIVLVTHSRNKGRKLDLSQDERYELVSSLKIVDKVVKGQENQDFFRDLLQIKPDIVCVGYDFKEIDLLKEKTQEVEKKLKKKIQIKQARKYKNYSTSLLRQSSSL